jgi:hypothetical protein
MKRDTSEDRPELYSMMAEKSCLGAALLDNNMVTGPLRDLAVPDFYLPAHRDLFSIILELSEDGIQFDEIVVGEILQQRHRLEHVGGLSYLADLQVGVVAHPGNIQRYAETVIKYAQLRRLQRLGAAIEQKSLEAGADPVLLVDKFTNLLNSLAAGYDLDGNLTPVVPRSLKRRADLIQLSRIEAKPVEWLWYPYVPIAMLTMLNGDPGVGKSYVALAMAADISNGRTPYSGEPCQPLNTLYLTIENSAAEVLRPRFDNLQGNPERFHLLRGSITGPEGDRASYGSVSLSDVALLDEALQRTNAGLAVIDPVQSYLGANVDFHRCNETRPILDGLFRLAEKHRCSFLLLRHLSKQQSGRVIHRGIGTIDFTGAVRSELLAGSAPDNPKHHALAHIKTNLGPIGDTVGYEIDAMGRFRWKDPEGLTASAMLAPETNPDEKSVLDEAQGFLREALAEGPRPVKELLSASRKNGISEPTLRRAKAKLGVISEKPPERDAPWVWQLAGKLQNG